MNRAGVDLYWLPLGAGGWLVRRCGRAYEALAAASDRRPRNDLYHSALTVAVPEGRFVIESGPDGGGDGAVRGVVSGGPVGHRLLGGLRLFRYELRCWRDGVIPDVGEAVESPQSLTSDVALARRLLELVPVVPHPVWGRDELGTGEMWNSNAIVSWLLATVGLDVGAIGPPAGGRAPGWSAGMIAAKRAASASGRTVTTCTGSRAP